MSTRSALWQLLWEVGTSRRLAWSVSCKAESEYQKRDIRDYTVDLERIVLFYGWVDNEELPGDKDMLWAIYWVDRWDTESDVEAAEWYRYEHLRQAAEAWLLRIYHKVTDTEESEWVKQSYKWKHDYYSLGDQGQ